MKLSDRVMSPPPVRKRRGRTPLLVAEPTPNPLPPELPILDYHDAIRTVPSLTRFRVRVLVEEPAILRSCNVQCPADLADFFWRAADGIDREVFMIVYADHNNHVLGWQKAFAGGLNRVAVEPRLILQTALLVGARSFAMGHNHPSGDPAPSAEDMLFTQRMREAADLVGIRMLDHLIVGERGRWVSLVREGRCY